MNKIPAAILLFALIACNNSGTSTNTSDQTDTLQQSTSALPELSCYQYNVGKDTVQLQLKSDGQNVSGNLIYKMNEKDSREGSINGVMKGDIIKANYTYNAEGTSTTQQLWLKIAGDKVYEGRGDFKDEGNGFTYADTNNIKYEQAFNKVDCK